MLQLILRSDVKNTMECYGSGVNVTGFDLIICNSYMEVKTSVVKVTYRL